MSRADGPFGMMRTIVIRVNPRNPCREQRVNVAVHVRDDRFGEVSAGDASLVCDALEIVHFFNQRPISIEKNGDRPRLRRSRGS
jgi:hypothetical protein